MTVEDACVKSGPQISFFFFRLVTKFLWFFLFYSCIYVTFTCSKAFFERGTCGLLACLKWGLKWGILILGGLGLAMDSF